MGTTSTELALPRIVEILAPEGEYEKKRIALRTEYAAVVHEAKNIVSVDTAEQAEAATNLGRLLQTATKETEAFFKTIKSQIDDIKKPILQAEKDDQSPYLTEKSRLGTLLTSYQAAERRKREEEERRAREEAERQAEADALQRAIELAAMGEPDAAEEVLAEPVIAAPVIILAAAPKPKGSVLKESFSAEVVDFKALVEAVAAGRVPLLALQPDHSFINNQARLFKDAFAYPGCKLKRETNTSFRS